MKVIFRFGITRLVITLVIIFSIANTLFDLYTAVVVHRTTSAGNVVVIEKSGREVHFESHHGHGPGHGHGHGQGQGQPGNAEIGQKNVSDKWTVGQKRVGQAAKVNLETGKNVKNYSVVAPKVNVETNHELKLKLHHEYWKLNSNSTTLIYKNKTAVAGNNSTGTTSDLDLDLDLDQEGEKELLRRIYYNTTLWGLNIKEGMNGFPKDYDNRFLLQKMWQLHAAKIQPEIFAGNKTKVIRLHDTFQWWKYDKGQDDLLSCAGPFNQRCQMVDSFFQGPVDAVIAVQDGFHNKIPLVGHDVFRIFFALESPFATPRINLVRPKDLLASYWRGSDIYTPYSTWLYYNPDVRRKPQTKNYAYGKTEMAAIFVSNCNSRNDRLEYVKELQKFMDVHIYGACGDRKCSRTAQDSCLAKLKKNYRFYLAFENSNCRDYITEKFFINAFQNDLIPVVMGAHPDDYKAIAPQNSFIHVEDFGGPAELALYLDELAGNEEAYNKYFEWKGTGEFISTDFFCRVCSLLYYSESHPPDGERRSAFHWQTNNNNNSDAEHTGMCLKPKRRYWTRTNS